MRKFDKSFCIRTLASTQGDGVPPVGRRRGWRSLILSSIHCLDAELQVVLIFFHFVACWTKCMAGFFGQLRVGNCHPRARPAVIFAHRAVEDTRCEGVLIPFRRPISLQYCWKAASTCRGYRFLKICQVWSAWTRRPSPYRDEAFLSPFMYPRIACHVFAHDMYVGYSRMHPAAHVLLLWMNTCGVTCLDFVMSNSNPYQYVRQLLNEITEGYRRGIELLRDGSNGHAIRSFRPAVHIFITRVRERVLYRFVLLT